MADKLVALLGSGKGPRMFTGRMRNLMVKVQGLTVGAVEVTHDEGLFVIESGGEYPLPDSQWVQFHHAGRCKTLICTIQSKINALHRTGPSTGDSDSSGNTGRAAD